MVELLVVITIIGILIGLLLPAVQAAREAGRRTQCLNNLKQMALACLAHESHHGHLPSSGMHWSGRAWAGDPDKGFGSDQPGGWHYNILPYLEQSALHDLGKGLSDAQRRATGKKIVETVVPLFICPSSGGAEPIKVEVKKWGNIDNPDVFGRSDYAACGGNRLSGYSNYNTRNQTGVIYSRSGLNVADILDGMSYTYLIGERYLNPDSYRDGFFRANDQGWCVGHDHDGIRWTDNHPNYAPRRNTPGIASSPNFGSPHNTFHMAVCDGGVRGFSYDIDPEIHFRLGHRKDGKVVPGDAF